MRAIISISKFPILEMTKLEVVSTCVIKSQKSIEKKNRVNSMGSSSPHIGS